ncbi:hypothetical protein FQR65_LT03512 [Abscondita terminalis]|nr:hypothetical protein FQR65_LT03512 [Abscondita terminalis]
MSKKYVKTPKLPKYCTPGTNTSDSETSVTSSETGDVCGTDLSIVAEYDELIRSLKQQRHDEIEDAFLVFVEQTKGVVDQWQLALHECKRLQDEVAKMTNDYCDLESKLSHARKLLDQERKRARNFEKERDEWERKVMRVSNIIHKNQNRGFDQTVKELSFLNEENLFDPDVNRLSHLSAIKEVNTTGSLISDFSYSRSEDDLDCSILSPKTNAVQKKRISDVGGQPPPKKRRSIEHGVVEINATDTVRATTTLTLNKDGPITATSIIESIPNEPKHDTQPSAPPAHLLHEGTKTTIRHHNFQSKTLVIPETCGPCNKRVRFGRTVFKCKDCRALCHPECKNLLPLPCIPHVNTPMRGTGVIGDYAPTTSPMVPALIVHCTREVESRGCNEIGIYRIPGAEKDVKALKERFVRGKTPPCINQIDIHVICGTIKDFLRNLQEPLITSARWHDFVKVAELQNDQEIAPLFNQLINELPQPNRDTLSFMMLHLKRVAKMPECKMPLENLVRVFSPTIIGYSSMDLNRSKLLDETRLHAVVMDKLINLPNEFWESFLETDIYQTPKSQLQPTPSTDSLLYPRSRALFSPYSVKSTAKKKQKFFPTP